MMIVNRNKERKQGYFTLVRKKKEDIVLESSRFDSEIDEERVLKKKRE